MISITIHTAKRGDGQCHRLKVATCESHSHFSVNGRRSQSRSPRQPPCSAPGWPALRHEQSDPTDRRRKQEKALQTLSHNESNREWGNSMIPTVPGTCIHRKSAFSAISDHPFEENQQPIKCESARRPSSWR